MKPCPRTLDECHARGLFPDYMLCPTCQFNPNSEIPSELPPAETDGKGMGNQDYARFLRVPVGDGASMFFPCRETEDHASLGHILRYIVQPTRADVLAAATCLDSYEYLVLNCTKEEAWRRIKAIRAALK